LACYVLDMRQTGGSRIGYHPFLLDICCVNAPTITSSESDVSVAPKIALGTLR